MAIMQSAIPEAPQKLPLQDRVVQFAGPADLVKRDNADAEKRRAEQAQNVEPVGSLAAYVRKAWEAAVNAKMTSGVLDQLLKCLNQRNGVYEDDVLSAIKAANGSEIFMMLTNIKCRAGEAWVKDIMLPAGEKPWALEPSPLIDLPEDKEQEITQQVTTEAAMLMAQAGAGIEAVSTDQIRARLEEIRDEVRKEQLKTAKATCKRMETKIEDELQAGGYYTAISELITDLMTFPTAFLKGPTIRKKKALTWTQDQNGDTVPAVEEKLTKTYDRISPFDMYPSPGAKSLQDGYLCERLHLRRADIIKMIGVPGWSEDALRGVLSDYGTGGLRQWLSGDYRRSVAENRPQEYEDPDPPIEGCLFNGPIQGKKLREWGMSAKQIPDPLMDYEAQVCLIGRWAVMARLNSHPLGHRNYYGASFEALNDAIWGKSPPQLMQDVQRICNAAARAIVNNMGIASGPQVEVYFQRLMAGENAERIWPWKIWKTKESALPNGKPAVSFFQPDMLAGTLLKVYEFFFNQASEQSGIPAYVYGNSDMGGAGGTASGLSMLMNAASKTLKNVVSHIDRNIISPSIHEHWLQLMLYDDTIDKYGDAQVVARASEYLIIQEQLQLRLNEFLDKTANPEDRAIIGEEGRATLLRHAAKFLRMPAEDVVPTKQEMEQRVNQAARLQGLPVGEENSAVLLSQGQGGAPGQAIPPAAVMAPDGGAVGREPGRMMQANA